MKGPTQPYPGLRPFERDEDAIFFGREEQTDQLLKKLGETRFVAVLGTSGSGKSSLVRAGVLPALEGGFLAAAGADWEIATLRPGDRPMEALAEALVRDTAWGEEYVGGAPPRRSEIVGGAPPPRPDEAPDRREGAPPTDSGAAALAADLRKGPMALNWLLGVQPLGSGARLLILVDQLEELFRYRHDAGGAAGAFVALLLAAAEHPSVYVVVTMRSDFLGDCARHPGLPEAVNAGLYLTPRLDPEQMADAIRLPARVFGGSVEPALVKRLLDEAGGETDQLPLLQHALMRLWDLADGEKRLTLRDFERLGGLPQALNDHADEAYRELNEAQRGVAEVLFRALSERGPDRRDTRRPTRLGDVAELAEVEPERVAAVADVFRGPGRSFLMPSPDVPLSPDSVLDITHEALIRQWRRLKDWTLAEAEQRELYRRLEGDWRRNRERETASLWHGYELSLARPWLADPERTRRWAARYSTGGEQAVVSSLALLEESARAADEAEAAAASERRRKLRQRWVRRTAVLTSLGLLAALGLAVWALNERHRAVEQERRGQESRMTAQVAVIRAIETRKAAESLLRFITFDLRDKLMPLGKLELLRDAQQRVDAYYELVDVLEDKPAVLRTRAANLLNSGDLQLALGDIAAAGRLYGEGTEIFRIIAEAEPDDNDRQRDLSVSLEKLGDIKAAQGDLAGALSAYEEGKAIRERLAASDPSNAGWQRDLSVSLEKLGDIKAAQGDLAGALSAYEEGKAIRERLAAADPSNAGWQRNLSVSLNKVGGIKAARGDLAGALSAYEDDLAIAERLAAADPSNAGWQRDLSVSLEKVGGIKAAQGDLAGALSAYEESKAIAERLAALEPSNAEWQRDLVVSLWKLSEDGLAEPEAARGYLQRALEILEGLEASGKLHGEHRDWPDTFRQRLQALDAPPN